ncbi:SIMPL domain-containing protein [Accumulibacter sp.]|uniref:SIMPL domain-containing protein n=1 Tax=Accumulibacter sp. TaxID=2053492 RepID=UPI002583F61F|nr:SIMPL domain-containing protein [Accumulibacter sp.]
MKRFRPLLHTLPLLALLVALPAPAAPGSGSGTSIDLAAEASRPAANDLARATVFAEAAGATPSELAKRVNGLIADGLKTARGYSNVRTQSGATYTYPVYAKGGKIESWRMRSDLTLECSDPAALSELLGKLQASLGVASLSMLPAPETRKKAENEATLDAITAFKARARLIADAFGKPYRIKHLAINSSGRTPPLPMLRAASLASAEAAAMPIEAGETLVTASVAGQIELPE